MKHLIFLSLLLTSIQAFSQLPAAQVPTLRGNEGRGVDPEVLIAIENKELLGKRGLDYFEFRKNLIKDKILSKSTQLYVAHFFRQVDASKLDVSIQPLYKELQALKADEAIEASMVEIKDECKDGYGVKKPAVTKPGERKICMDLELLTLLDLYYEIKSDNIKDYNIGFVHDPSNASEQLGIRYDINKVNPGAPGYLFAVFMHETARQFGKDNDHKLFRAMRKEYARHLVLEKPSTSQQLFIGNSDYSDYTCLAAVNWGSTSCWLTYTNLPPLTRYSLNLGVDYRKGENAIFKAHLKPGANSECLSEVKVWTIMKAKGLKRAWGIENEFRTTKLDISADGKTGEFIFETTKYDIPTSERHEVNFLITKKFYEWNCGPNVQLTLEDSSGNVISSVAMDQPFYPDQTHRRSGPRVYNLIPINQ